ncbi:PREDICTED: testicular haploid expressed gene protein-like [Amphimedon queenslandica]|uniref:Testicular haploid expressed gene protein-like n=1 Tax=Amphimedon queenslandica TaxID=400682 RepID=A0A1X7VLD1_AMPQE|nr:PREDICTED: testicular haploid expressed gene protein-like [Amphimedon queenslandica]|eukprot:XP_011409976.1 PREDICTED: testicular haploid expressed gene protein-like [Amphimedon queenslandica]
MTVTDNIAKNSGETSGGGVNGIINLPSTHTPRGCNIMRPDIVRITELSTPRGTKKDWWTTYGPPLVWGNQETIWQLNPATLTYTPSNRLRELALPKVDHCNKNHFTPEFQYSCGRGSQIWKVKKSAMKAVPTERTMQLAKHKMNPSGFEPFFMLNCGRSSPIWRPSKAALSAKLRPRTALLAQPKELHKNYLPPRQVQTRVSSAIKRSECNEYIHRLAQPKERPDGPFRDAEWPVSKGALQAEPTQRLNELSRPKRLAEGHEASRDGYWRVTNGAKSAVASSRISELAKPIIRATMDHVQFNPDVFQVSPAAKKYIASPRIEELAQPIQRR